MEVEIDDADGEMPQQQRRRGPSQDLPPPVRGSGAGKPAQRRDGPYQPHRDEIRPAEVAMVHPDAELVEQQRLEPRGDHAPPAEPPGRAPPIRRALGQEDREGEGDEVQGQQQGFSRFREDLARAGKGRQDVVKGDSGEIEVGGRVVVDGLPGGLLHGAEGVRGSLCLGQGREPAEVVEKLRPQHEDRGQIRQRELHAEGQQPPSRADHVHQQEQEDRRREKLQERGLRVDRQQQAQRIQHELRGREHRNAPLIRQTLREGEGRGIIGDPDGVDAGAAAVVDPQRHIEHGGGEGPDHDVRGVVPGVHIAPVRHEGAARRGEGVCREHRRHKESKKPPGAFFGADSLQREKNEEIGRGVCERGHDDAGGDHVFGQPEDDAYADVPQPLGPVPEGGQRVPGSQHDGPEGVGGVVGHVVRAEEPADRGGGEKVQPDREEQRGAEAAQDLRDA